MDKEIIYSSFLLNKKKDKEDIFKIYKNLNVSFFTYSRIALFKILEFHNKKVKQTICIPSLICRDILSSINNLNYKIVFYEVDESLSPILNKNIKIDIVLIVNYFGFGQNLKNFQEFINKNKCITIEDNSHGFLSKDINGNLLGTRLDYGIISVYKSINIFNGSILINNTKNIIKEYKIYKKFNIAYFIKKSIYFILIRSSYLNLKIFNFINSCRKIFNLANKNNNNDDEINLPNYEKVYDNLKLRSLPFNYANEIKRRKKNYIYIDQILKNEKIIPIFNNLDDKTVPFCYPFYCEPENVDRLNRIMNKKNFVLIKWPALPSIIKKQPNFYSKIYYITFKI
jgi:hypothetical protein